MTTLHLKTGGGEYDITVGRGILGEAARLFNLGRRVIILTDSGVPKEYSERIAGLAREAKILTVAEGEGSKSLATLEDVLRAMAEFNMTRGDCLVAVGGGVVGDLGGFAASCYMRGIDFYNVPTTLLAQVDSSIGGKTAVNLGGIKNIVGAFYQPKGVLIDTSCLDTLDQRQVSAGLAEVVKMAMTSDAALFSKLENKTLVDIMADIEPIIVSALKIKRAVVEADEREAGVRRILNFGHTVGHGIEALTGLYHGECVALGMIPLTAPRIRARLISALRALGLPTEWRGDVDAVIALAAHDKKCVGNGVMAVAVDEIGSYKIKKMTAKELGDLCLAAFA